MAEPRNHQYRIGGGTGGGGGGAVGSCAPVIRYSVDCMFVLFIVM